MPRGAAYVAKRRAEEKGMGWRGCVADPPINPALLSPLPATSCIRCGHRGWCEHRSPW